MDALFEALRDFVDARQGMIGTILDPKLLTADWLIEDDKLDAYRGLLGLSGELEKAHAQGLC